MELNLTSLQEQCRDDELAAVGCAVRRTMSGWHELAAVDCAVRNKESVLMEGKKILEEQGAREGKILSENLTSIDSEWKFLVKNITIIYYGSPNVLNKHMCPHSP